MQSINFRSFIAVSTLEATSILSKDSITSQISSNLNLVFKDEERINDIKDKIIEKIFEFTQDGTNYDKINKSIY